MSTTLEGYFFEDEDNLHRRIEEALAKNRLDRPWKAIVSFQDLGSQTYPKIAEVTGEALQVKGILAVVETIKAEVIARKGADCVGSLKVRIYEANRSNDMAVDFTRKIGADGTTTTDRVFTERLMARTAHLEQQLNEKDKQLNAQAAVLGQLAVEQNKTISALATQRAVTTGAADAQGLGTLITLGVLLFGWPLMRRMLDLPEDSSPAQLLQLLTRSTTSAVDRWMDQVNQVNQVKPQHRPSPEDVPQASQLADVSPESTALPPPEQVLAMLINAPEAYKAQLKETLAPHLLRLMANQ